MLGSYLELIKYTSSHFSDYYTIEEARVVKLTNLFDDNSYSEAPFETVFDLW